MKQRNPILPAQSMTTDVSYREQGTSGKEDHLSGGELQVVTVQIKGNS
jgi:hypothetical protein